MEDNEKRIIIEIDKEFLDVLKKLETKIKSTTWEGLDKVSFKSLTRILARKIIASKLI